MTKPQVFSTDIMNYGFFTPCSFFNGTIAIHPSPPTNRSVPLVEKEPSDTIGSCGRHFKCGKEFKSDTTVASKPDNSEANSNVTVEREQHSEKQRWFSFWTEKGMQIGEVR
jgi:hypothetical protein